MIDKLRFRRLEKARPGDRDGAPVATGAGDRLEKIEAGQGGGGDPSTGLKRERFEEQLPLAAADPNQPLFRRCRLCGADNQRGDVRCNHCDGDLLSPEQEAFDARLLTKQTLEEKQEREAALQPAEPVGQRQLGEALAGMVAEAQREDEPPVRRLPGPLRWVAYAAALTLIAFLSRYRYRSTGWYVVSILADVAFVLLVVPRRGWRWLGAWWW